MARYNIREWYDHWLEKNRVNKFEKELNEIGFSKKHFSFMRPMTGCLAHVLSCWCDEPACRSASALLIQQEKQDIRVPMLVMVHKEQLLEVYGSIPEFMADEYERIFNTFLCDGDPIESDIKELEQYGLRLDPKNYFDL